MKRLLTILCIPALLLLGAAEASGEDYDGAALEFADDSLKADRGVFLEAVRQKRARWRAEEGNAEAQNDLGLMYANGQGVARDYSQASE